MFSIEASDLRSKQKVESDNDKILSIAISVLLVPKPNSSRNSFSFYCYGKTEQKILSHTQTG